MMYSRIFIIDSMCNIDMIHWILYYFSKTNSFYMDQLSKEEKHELLDILMKRFWANMHRHIGIDWKQVQEKLEQNPSALFSISHMEKTGWEPDVVLFVPDSESYVFFDCSEESPKGRRSLCYDTPALNARKENKPSNSAWEVAITMGVELLSEEDYKFLQQLGSFDQKTSSWIDTPPAIRNLGWALFGDRRYNQVFIYHNGADSYYAARWFRGKRVV